MSEKVYRGFDVKFILYTYQLCNTYYCNYGLLMEIFLNGNLSEENKKFECWNILNQIFIIFRLNSNSVTHRISLIIVFIILQKFQVCMYIE